MTRIPFAHMSRSATEVPQMMRLNITTYNVLEMLGNWEIARPYIFYCYRW